MKKNKKAFTLIELMATLSIFSIAMIIVSTILIQGQNILNKVDNRSAIQDEIRTAMMIIESAANSADEIIVEYGMWELDEETKEGIFYSSDIDKSKLGVNARELVRFSQVDEEGIAKAYAEVNYGDKHQLIEFSIYETNNEIKKNTTKVLISEIEGDDINTIPINENLMDDSNSNTKLVTINFSDIIKGKDISINDYIVSFTNEGINETEINVGGGNGNEVTGSDNESGRKDVKFKSEVTANWGSSGEWRIELTNNTGKDIKAWSITIESNNLITVWPGWGNIQSLGNNLFKLYNEENMYKAQIKNGDTIEIKGNYQGQSELIMKSINFECSYY